MHIFKYIRFGKGISSKVIFFLPKKMTSSKSLIPNSHRHLNCSTLDSFTHSKKSLFTLKQYTARNIVSWTRLEVEFTPRLNPMMAVRVYFQVNTSAQGI